MGISFDFFSSAYLDVSVRQVRLFNLWIQLKIVRYYSDWVAPFGYLRVNAFFQLAVVFRRLRVLLRLLMPRHPPIALNSLTKNYLVLLSFEFFYDSCSLKQLRFSYTTYFFCKKNYSSSADFNQ